MRWSYGATAHARARWELLLAVRRSNRALSARPVPQELLDRIVAAADRAPDGEQCPPAGVYAGDRRGAAARCHGIYARGFFGTLEKRLLHPLVRPWLSRLVPGVYRYVPVFKRLRREYAEGRDRVLRGADGGAVHPCAQGKPVRCGGREPGV